MGHIWHGERSETDRKNRSPNNRAIDFRRAAPTVHLRDVRAQINHTRATRYRSAPRASAIRTRGTNAFIICIASSALDLLATCAALDSLVARWRCKFECCHPESTIGRMRARARDTPGWMYWESQIINWCLCSSGTALIDEYIYSMLYVGGII